ncbi:mRNA 3' end processing factor [Sporothrix eucalyptigena]|uniref:mRNA 3' end processing factor n=1 Tax=Sporothrix eucalyptigena TaxID=1812306 RepID=A0ABP0BP26_9PEZI
MSYEDHSEDVASDFRDALSELTMNSRVEITTLTVIARENTEYAHGISEVLQEHIKKVAPQRKLPALYLLDSIVKNVGTPYTIYFGRGLYSTFMDAYASVDNGTRRKMDEMLKTWKEPVPGSVDPRPVFSPETTRPIENALIKARTSTLQAHHEHMRSEQQLLGRGRPTSATPYRETPTPPGQASRPGYSQQPPYGQQQPPQQTPQQQVYPFHTPSIHATAGGPFQPPEPQQQQPPQYPNPYAPSAASSRTSVETLNEDVERLIQATKTEFAEKPYDASVAGRLKALIDLQTILKSQSLEHDKLVLVRNQIDALAVNLPGHLKANINTTPTPPAAAYPPFQPPPAAAPAGAAPLSAAVLAALAAARAKAAQGSTPPVQTPAPLPPQPPAQPGGGVSIDTLLGKGALAAILAARQQQSAQQQQQQQPLSQPAYVPTPTSQLPPQLLQGVPAAPNAANPLALMEMLRKAGILQQQTPAAGAPFQPPAPPPAAPVLNVPGLANIIASIRSPAFAATRDPLREIQNEISFTSSSLKQFRPHLLPLMYDNLGPPCTQCGRRFRTDDAGRAAKTAHMDWHFRVHQRIVEAEKRGQHRSWYVDQADWIHSRETVDSDGVDHGADGSGGPSGSQSGRGSGSSTGTGAGGAGDAPGGKLQWIPVPTGNANTNQTCPICQEKFEMKWLDEAQEWVWIDAVRVGSRVYHASCHAEATRSGNNRDHPAAAAMSAMMSGNRGNGPVINGPIPTGPAADRNRPVLGKRKANDDANFHGNGNHRQNQKNGARGGANAGGGGRKKKRGGLGGAGGGNPRRPPDLDRVDPDIGGNGGGSGSGDGAGGGGGRFGRNGGKHRGGGHNNDSNSEDAKVDLNALPY